MTSPVSLPEDQVPVFTALKEMADRRDFGSLEVKIEFGRVILIRRTETIKVAGRDQRGGANGQSNR